jgi:hypothetical protein
LFLFGFLGGDGDYGFLFLCCGFDARLEAADASGAESVWPDFSGGPGADVFALGDGLDSDACGDTAVLWAVGIAAPIVALDGIQWCSAQYDLGGWAVLDRGDLGLNHQVLASIIKFVCPDYQVFVRLNAWMMVLG